MKRWIFGIVGGLLVLLLAAVLIAPQMIPSEVYKTRIEAAARSALGRDVTIEGDVKLKLFPRIEARTGAVRVSNPEGFSDAPFASMKELRAAVKLIPLFFSRVEVDEFVLVEPNIALISRADGSNNWTFETATDGAETDADKDAQTSSSSMSASLGDVRIVDGAISWEDQANARVHTLADLNLSADMKAFDKPFSIKASGLADRIAFKLNSRLENPAAMFAGQMSKANLNLETDLIQADLDGDMALGLAPTFDFKFDGRIPDVGKLADAAGVTDLPARTALGSVRATGTAKGKPGDIVLEVQDARHESPLLNADFNGDIKVADAISFDIQASAESPEVDKLAAALNIEAPGGEVLGAATATTHVTGQLDALSFEDVTFRHVSDLLRLSFDGAAKLAKDLTYDGQVEIASPDVRRLAKATGAELPPGDVYKSFSFSGRTSGSTNRLALSDAVVSFDEIRGAGNATLLLDGKPKLVGSLTTNKIDITPYAVSSGAPASETSATNGWGDTPIDLSPLKLADVDMKLKAEGVSFQKFDFGPSNIDLTLQDGRLQGKLSQTSLFGGAGNVSLVADGSGSKSAVELDANINGLMLKPLMVAAANFQRLDGTGDIKIKLNGRGDTLQQLMSSLSGDGSVQMADGAIHGVDMLKLVQEAPAALKSRALPSGAFGADAATQIRKLAGAFKVEDGVAVMPDLTVQGAGMKVTGGASLDVGRQRLSLSLFPEFTDSSVGIKGYGLPVKISGGWNNVSVAPDFDWLVQRAQSQVRAKVEDEVKDELRKQLGDKLGFALPGSSSSTSSSAPAQTDAQPEEAAAEAETSPAAAPAGEKPASTEDLLKQEAKKALQDALKRR
ncbi:MAG: AsmA family protein [Hyphomonadaceae bacterium]